MPERTREEGGEFAAEVGEDEILAAVREYDPAATSEVAEAVGLTRQAADYRLRQLAEDGVVVKKKIAASLVWSPTEPAGWDGDGPGAGEGVPPDTGASAPGGATEETPGWREDVRGLDLEGAGSRLTERRGALEAIVGHLEEHGAASASELKELAGNFDHGYQNADAFWSNMRRQDVFDELPVETPGRGGKEYRFSE